MSLATTTFMPQAPTPQITSLWSVNGVVGYKAEERCGLDANHPKREARLMI